jgi:hypothetical protein
VIIIDVENPRRLDAVKRLLVRFLLAWYACAEIFAQISICLLSICLLHGTPAPRYLRVFCLALHDNVRQDVSPRRLAHAEALCVRTREHAAYSTANK